MAASSPRIVCLDLDTFFVSVERVLDPSLAGKPVIVGGAKGQRGVVTACSYEVRAFGVHSGMSLTMAAQLAPNAIFISTRHGLYGTYAEQVRAIAARFTPIMRVASIDEMYLDFRGCEAMYARANDVDSDATIVRVVREMTATIQAELALPSSAGIATSKVMAKVASGLAKPAGVLLVTAGSDSAVLGPLSVRKLPGIGPVTERRLAEAGYTTLGQLIEADEDELQPLFGSWTETLIRNLHGRGCADLGRDRPAFSEHDVEGETVGSISNERTFREDVGDPATIESMLCSLVERVCWRARKRGVKARTVTLKLRYADFQTLSRSKTVAPTHLEADLYPVVKALYQLARTRRTAVRLLGVALSNLDRHSDQGALFADGDQVHRAVDAIREKFGYDALRRAQSKRNWRQGES